MSQDQEHQSAEEMLARVKGRNMAIAWSLVGFVVLVFVVTIVRMGPDILVRPL